MKNIILGASQDAWISPGLILVRVHEEANLGSLKEY
jgi:hypothetical protein